MTVGTFRVISILIIVGTLPIITRLYDPLEYAEWLVWTSVALLFSAIATLCYEFSIVLPKRDDDAASLLVTGFVVCCGMSLVGFLAISIVGAWSPEFLTQRFALWNWSIPLFLWSTGVFNLCGGWCVRKTEFAWYAGCQLIAPSLTAFFQIGAALASLTTSTNLIQASLIGQGIATVVIATRVFMKHGAVIIESAGLQRVWKMAKQYRMYPIAIAPRNFVSMLRGRLIFFVLDTFGSKSSVSMYGIAYRLVNFPVTLLASAARPVYFQHAASEGLRSAERIVLTALRVLSFIAAPFWILFLFQAKAIFGFALGEAWADAGFYAALLSFAAVPNLLGNWIDRTFDVAGKQQTALALELGFSATAIIGVLLSVLIFDDVMWVVVVQIVVMTAYYWYFLYKIFETAKFAISDFWGIIKLFTGMSVVWFAIAWVFLTFLSYWIAVGLYLIMLVAACAIFLVRYVNPLRGVKTRG